VPRHAALVRRELQAAEAADRQRNRDLVLKENGKVRRPERETGRGSEGEGGSEGGGGRAGGGGDLYRPAPPGPRLQ
jgi:uncharacterized membrane protein YgcG